VKIAHLDTGYDWRGGQAQVMHLARGLRARGHESILLGPPAPLLERAAGEGFEVHPWRARGDLDLPGATAAAARVRSLGVDLVHAHTAGAHLPGWVAARWSGVPVVVARRVAVPPRSLSSRFKYRLGIDRYLCVSRSVIEVLARAGVPRSRLAWVPSGVELTAPGEAAGSSARDPADPPPPSLHAEIGAPAGAPIVGTVASLTREKRHGDILAAAVRVLERFPDTHFVWIGDGGGRHALESRRRALGLEARVHLLGFRQDARRLMKEFTLCVLASVLEGLGSSLLDAQALGVPVIATRVGGIPEVVADGVTGRLVPPGQPEELARAVIDALDRPESRACWAARALESVRAFGVDRMVERTLAEYQAVLEERSPDRGPGAADVREAGRAIEEARTG